MLAGLMNWIATTPFLAAVYVIAAVGAFVVLSLWIRYIPNTRVGIVEKLISGKGSVPSGFIALNGGPQFKFTPTISFFVKCKTKREIEELWRKLSVNGTTLMKLAQYPFSEKFG